MKSPTVRAVIACVGFFLITLDASIVNVALPSLGSELGADIADLQWIVDGYTLALAGLVVVAGAASDRLGAERVFRWGLVGFGLMSAACAAAPSVDALIGARVLQGIAGAAVLPSSMAVVVGAFTRAHNRQKALGWWAAGGGVAVATGPVIGGIFVDAWGWRAIFLAGVPVALVAASVVATDRTVHTTRTWDLLGQAQLVTALVAGVFVLIEGGHGSTGWPVWVAALVAVRAAIAVARRARRGSTALPLDQLQRPGVLLATITGAMLNMTFFGVVFTLSLMLQEHTGLSASGTGLVLLPASVLILAANLGANACVDRLGTHRTLAVALVCEAGGFGLAALVAGGGLTPPGWWVTAALIPAGLGAGLASPVMMTVLMQATDPDRAGSLAGFLNGARQAGTALGVATAGILVTSTGQVDGTASYCALSCLILSSTAVYAARMRNVTTVRRHAEQ